MMPSLPTARGSCCPTSSVSTPRAGTRTSRRSLGRIRGAHRRIVRERRSSLRRQLVELHRRASSFAPCALSLPAGAPVLVPALTFIATASAVRCAGLSPVVADVDPDNWLLTPEIARARQRGRSARARRRRSRHSGADQDGEAWTASSRATHGVPRHHRRGRRLRQPARSRPTCAIFQPARDQAARGWRGRIRGHARDAALAHSIRRLSNFGINLDRPNVTARSAPRSPTGTNAKLSEYHAAVALATSRSLASTSRAERAAPYAHSDPRGAGGMRRTTCAASRGPGHRAQRVRYRFLTPASATAPRRHARQRGIGTRRWYLPTIDRQPAFGHVAHLLPTPTADYSSASVCSAYRSTQDSRPQRSTNRRDARHRVRFVARFHRSR